MVARWGLVLVVGLVLGVAPQPLRADGATLPEGRGAVSLTVQSGLSKGEGGEPLSVAPDAWYGLSHGTQVGLVSSLQGLYGFWSGAIAGVSGSGACLSGTPDEAGGAGCGGLYESAGAEVLFGGQVGGSFQALVGGGAHMIENDPVSVRVKAGLRVRWQLDERFSISMSPSFLNGSDERLLFAPVDVGVAIAPRLRVGLQSGYLRTFRESGQDWSAIPVAAGVVFVVTPTLVTGASFSFDRVGGYQGPDPFDQRSASLMVGTML